MTKLVIEGLDPAVIAILRARAVRTGRSLEEEARDLLTDATRTGASEAGGTGRDAPDRTEFLASLDHVRSATRGRIGTDVLSLLREDRDR